jgi:hypothetical protein
MEMKMDYVVWFLASIAVVVPACAGLVLTEWLEARGKKK